MTRKTDKPKNKKNTQTDFLNQTYMPKPNFKDIAVENLRKKGFNVRNESGILMVYYKGKDDYESILQKFESALHEIKYESSYGIKPSTGAVEFGEIQSL